MIPAVSRGLFCLGLFGIALYIVCLVVPYELYVFRLSPDKMTPGPAPGYLALPPFGFIAYWLVSYPEGWLWLMLCTTAVIYGKPPFVENPRFIGGLRWALVMGSIWAASYVRVMRDSLGSILE